MARPKKENSESKSFAIYNKTWLLLKDLEHLNLQNNKMSKPLKEIAHEATEMYYKEEKKKR